VVEQFIFYLAHSPTDTTSPLFLELNTTAMLAALGGPDSGVTIYDTNSQPSNLPFVKLSDSGKRQRKATFTNGGSYWEMQTLNCQCVATGLTPSSATNNAELLKLAVEGLIKKTRLNIASLPTRTDLGGTGSNESIGNLQIGQIDQETPLDGQEGEYTASRMALIEVWVYKERKL
jgi:hypothetical protein